MSSIATTNETSNVTSLPSTSKAQTAKEVIAANVKLLIEQLEAGHSEGLTAYLTAMGRFHNYSFGNILEIARQKPDATRVAGMYAWNQLGRKVIKGQKGIRILAPMIGIRKKKDKEAEKDITKQNQPGSLLRNASQDVDHTYQRCSGTRDAFALGRRHRQASVAPCANPHPAVVKLRTC
jgi:hypothetical protein